jgi:hypothetical protein
MGKQVSYRPTEVNVDLIKQEQDRSKTSYTEAINNLLNELVDLRKQKLEITAKPILDIRTARMIRTLRLMLGGSVNEIINRSVVDYFVKIVGTSLTSEDKKSYLPVYLEDIDELINNEDKG